MRELYRSANSVDKWGKQGGKQGLTRGYGSPRPSRIRLEQAASTAFHGLGGTVGTRNPSWASLGISP